MSVMTLPGSPPTALPSDASDCAPSRGGRGVSQPTSPQPSGSWKQRPCAYFQRTGTCRYGAGCRFEHALPTPGGIRLWSHAQVLVSAGVCKQAASMEIHQPRQIPSLLQRSSRDAAMAGKHAATNCLTADCVR